MSRVLVTDTTPISYIDRRQLLRSQQPEKRFRASQQALQNASTTLYVGNLGYHTREVQVAAHFQPYGVIREVAMGLSAAPAPLPSDTASGRTPWDLYAPCGFCFVVFESRDAAVAAQQALHKSLLDDRIIHVGWDVGLLPAEPCIAAVVRSSLDLVEAAYSRRWGRGCHGGQVVDSLRQNHDEGRGGLGVLRKASLGLCGMTGDQKDSYLDVEAEAQAKRRSTRWEAFFSGKTAEEKRNLWNAYHGLESEGEESHYYWVEGPKKKRRRNEGNTRFQKAWNGSAQAVVRSRRE